MHIQLFLEKASKMTRWAQHYSYYNDSEADVLNRRLLRLWIAQYGTAEES